jgi:hypothetical protein
VFIGRILTGIPNFAVFQDKKARTGWNNKKEIGLSI